MTPCSRQHRSLLWERLQPRQPKRCHANPLRYDRSEPCAKPRQQGTSWQDTTYR
ncbi:hypothetical protein [Lysobacter gummosus]|uniref:hypothetical protein n=1 Tax=Lysobacter gummosus TaxID=262324 RepID=UPI00362B5981